MLSCVERDEYITLESEGEIAIERLSAANNLLDGLRFSPPTGGLPHGLAEADRDEFQGGTPVGNALVGLIAEGAALAAAERQGRGLAMAPAAGAVAPIVVPLHLPLVPAPAMTTPGMSPQAAPIPPARISGLQGT